MQTLDELIAALQVMREQHGGKMRVKVLDPAGGAHDIEQLDVERLLERDGRLSEPMLVIYPDIDN